MESQNQGSSIHLKLPTQAYIHARYTSNIQCAYKVTEQNDTPRNNKKCLRSFHPRCKTFLQTKENASKLCPSMKGICCILLMVHELNKLLYQTLITQQLFSLSLEMCPVPVKLGIFVSQKHANWELL